MKSKEILIPDMRKYEGFDPSFSALAARLRLARQRTGLTLSDVAAGLGISSQAAQQYEAAKARPDLERIAELAKLLRVDVAWLALGIASGLASGDADRLADRISTLKTGEAQPKVGLDGVRVYVLDEDDLDVLNRPDERLTRVSGQIVTHGPCSTGSWAVRITTSRNSPRYEPGDLVVCDPDAKPQPGDMVAVETPEGILLGRIKWADPKTLQIESIHPDWLPVTVPVGRNHSADRPWSQKILGVVVEHTKPRRR